MSYLMRSLFFLSGVLRQIPEQVWKLLLSWYSVDRVRVSPSAGRLRQLRVGDRIVLFDELYALTERDVQYDGVYVFILWRLQTPAVTGVLTVSLNGQRRSDTPALLSIGHRERQVVYDEDVTVVTPADCEELNHRSVCEHRLQIKE